MEKTQKHTPTPWRLDICKDGGDWTYSIREANPSSHQTIGKQVAILNEYLWPEENAQFIVKAVNSHDGLVGALKAISELAPSTCRNIEESCVCIRCISIDALRSAGVEV